MSSSALPPARRAALPAVTAALLASTALVPAVGGSLGDGSLLAVIAALVGVTGLGWLAALRRQEFSGLRSAVRPVLELLLHLSPVALLTLIFPVATERLSGTQVGGTALTTLLLASSLTVPWLGQAVCMPLYRVLGPLIHAGEQDKIRSRYVNAWPAAFLQSLPAVVVFAVPVQLALRWTPAALGTYVMLILLHLLFAQSLVLANIGRQRWLWAAAWGGYAAVLLLLPSAWYLPPLVGTLIQMIPLRRSLQHLRHPARLDGLDVARDLRRGLLLGAVLWADKFLLLLHYGNDFPVTTVFLALLPAVLAYNYYFVRLAPQFDVAVLELRSAMENDRFDRLSSRSSSLIATVVRSLVDTAFLGALLGLVVTVIVRDLEPTSTALVAAVSLASWLFMITTVASYKLDYIGQLGQAQRLGAAHLVLCTITFAVLPLGAPLYLVLVVVEACIAAVAVRSCLRHWRASEYTLFWRHAVAW